MKKSLVINIIHHTSELSALELMNLKNLLSLNCGRYDIIFFLPLSYRETQLVEDFKQITFHFVENRLLSSNKSYNRFLISKEYYSQFKDYEYLLVYQLDTWAFSLDLDSILLKDFDFVGAPILSEDRHLPIKVIDGCNGGVSIRKISTFLRVLDINYFFSLYNLYSHIGFGNKNNQPYRRFFKFILSPFILYTRPNVLWPFHINEDLFWTVIIPQKFKDFKISDTKTSCEFCFDQEPEYMYILNNKKIPLFAHAVEKYNFKFWAPHIFGNDYLEK